MEIVAFKNILPNDINSKIAKLVGIEQHPCARRMKKIIDMFEPFKNSVENPSFVEFSKELTQAYFISKGMVIYSHCCYLVSPPPYEHRHFIKWHHSKGPCHDCYSIRKH